MVAQLDLVANRAATWSQSANRLRKRIDFIRWLVFALAITGALLAAVASQTLDAQALHGALTALGTVLLAAGTFISARLLTDSDLEAWVRMRAAAEALKREAYKYATGARPYDNGATADQVLDRGREDIEKDLDDLSDRTITLENSGSAPTKKLTADEYQSLRVIGQAERFYRPRAKDYQAIAARLRVAEFVLALTATIITALAAVVGKLPVVFGVGFDLAALTAVFTTISGAILAHIEASRYQYLVTSYLATARRLENAAVDFDVAKVDAQKWSDYVNSCEDVIAAENSSWVARWTKSKK